MTSALRAALVVAGLALVFAGVRRHQGHDACASARADVFHIVLKKAPATDAPAAARGVARHCRDTTLLAESSVALLRVNQTGPALALATTATHREPGVRNGWLALSLTLRKTGDTAAANRALARARQLDPVGLRGS
jgi:Flp pilus assembly protein TadD